uniref:Uncharacterized protein n=1 Tax=Pediastrum angulosum TaxID=271408 RepID=A0A2U8GHH5_9CHLO|nr:hypothetical protein [Pediastrum angulosum]YP_009492031.1 hypothetical protein [Pediastrum angulosum]AWI68147.1 hypothetical protein [Pediastrum angulosum]AWI68149.1 hypothetical protein [Pediastrum angulosum]
MLLYRFGIAECDNLRSFRSALSRSDNLRLAGSFCFGIFDSKIRRLSLLRRSRRKTSEIPKKPKHLLRFGSVRLRNRTASSLPFAKGSNPKQTRLPLRHFRNLRFRTRCEFGIFDSKSATKASLESEIPKQPKRVWNRRFQNNRSKEKTKEVKDNLIIIY